MREESQLELIPSATLPDQTGYGVAMHTRAYRHLTAEERETLSLGLAHGHSRRAMTRILDRAPSTMSREVAWSTTRAHHPRPPGGIAWANSTSLMTHIVHIIKGHHARFSLMLYQPRTMPSVIPSQHFRILGACRRTRIKNGVQCLSQRWRQAIRKLSGQMMFISVDHSLPLDWVTRVRLAD